MVKFINAWILLDKVHMGFLSIFGVSSHLMPYFEEFEVSRVQDSWLPAALIGVQIDAEHYLSISSWENLAYCSFLMCVCIKLQSILQSNPVYTCVNQIISVCCLLRIVNRVT